jgi:hypothetical protein
MLYIVHETINAHAKKIEKKEKNMNENSPFGMEVDLPIMCHN